MRPEPASNQISDRPTVLVLADRGIGELLSERLRAIGFDPRVQSPPSFNSSSEQLRDLLREFLEKEKPGPKRWLHPGVTPVAERSEWPTLCREQGFGFLGPSARSLSLFNNRLSLLGEAEKLSIPNLLLSPDPLHSVREIEKSIRTSKFKLPLVLKSVRGGSGLGVRVIHQPEDLGKSLELWLEEIRKNLGEVIILAEKYLEGARRIVQPFVRHPEGHVDLLPAIDASLTSRLRKIAEFCPAIPQENFSESNPELSQIRNWTMALAQRTGYVGVGSLEFLTDGPKAYMIEGLPRLNTSFCLWERVAGVSAVALQLGSSFEESKRAVSKTPAKMALALRIHAEDPVLQLPQPGAVIELTEKREWSFPGANATLNMSISTPSEVTYRDSSVLGYLWIEAEDRKRALTVARGLLDEIWVAGSIQTNERYLQELMSHPWVSEGVFHASFVDEEFIPSIRADLTLLKIAGRMAQLLDRGAGASSGAVKWAVGDQWVKSTEGDYEWKIEPSYSAFEKKACLSGVVQVEGGQTVRAFCFPLSADRWQCRVGNWFFSVRKIAARSSSAGATQKLSALLSGRVHSVLFREGAWVPAHEPALIVESLGMLIPHALPVDVRIVRWHVAAEDVISAGQMLAEFERAPQVR